MWIYINIPLWILFRYSVKVLSQILHFDLLFSIIIASFTYLSFAYHLLLTVILFSFHSIQIRNSYKVYTIALMTLNRMNNKRNTNSFFDRNSNFILFILDLFNRFWFTCSIYFDFGRTCFAEVFVKYLYVKWMVPLGAYINRRNSVLSDTKAIKTKAPTWMNSIQPKLALENKVNSFNFFLALFAINFFFWYRLLRICILNMLFMTSQH